MNNSGSASASPCDCIKWKIRSIESPFTSRMATSLFLSSFKIEWMDRNAMQFEWSKYDFILSVLPTAFQY